MSAGSAFQIDKKIVRTEIGVLLRLSHPNIVSRRPQCPHPSMALGEAITPSPGPLGALWHSTAPLSAVPPFPITAQWGLTPSIAAPHPPPHSPSPSAFHSVSNFHPGDEMSSEANCPSVRNAVRGDKRRGRGAPCTQLWGQQLLHPNTAETRFDTPIEMPPALLCALPHPLGTRGAPMGASVLRVSIGSPELAAAASPSIQQRLRSVC